MTSAQKSDQRVREAAQLGRGWWSSFSKKLTQLLE